MIRKIKLTESDIRRMVMEAINELSDDDKLNRQTLQALNNGALANRRKRSGSQYAYDMDSDNTIATIKALCQQWKEENCEIDENGKKTKLIIRKSPLDYRTPSYYALVQAVIGNSEGSIVKSRSGKKVGRCYDQRFFMYSDYENIVNEVRSAMNYSGTGRFISEDEYKRLPETEQMNYRWSKAKNAYEETKKREQQFNLNDENSVQIFKLMSDAIQCAMTTGVIGKNPELDNEWYKLKDKNGNPQSIITLEDRYKDYYKRRMAYYKQRDGYIPNSLIDDDNDTEDLMPTDTLDSGTKRLKRQFLPKHMIVPVLFQADIILSSDNVYDALKTHLYRQCEKYIEKEVIHTDILHDGYTSVSPKDSPSSNASNRPIDRGMAVEMNGDSTIDDMSISDMLSNTNAPLPKALKRLKNAFYGIAYKNIEGIYTIDEYKDLVAESKDKKNPRAKATADWIATFVKVPYTEFDDSPNGEDPYYYAELSNNFNDTADKVADGNIIAVCKYLYNKFSDIFSPENIQKCYIGTKTDSNSQDGEEKSDSKFFSAIKKLVNKYVVDANIPSVRGGTQTNKLMDSFWAMFSNVFHTKKQIADRETGEMIDNPNFDKLLALRRKFKQESAYESKQRKLINRIVNETIKRYLKML